MPQIKLFKNDSAEELEKEVNAWLGDDAQRGKIQIHQLVRFDSEKNYTLLILFADHRK